MRRLGMTTALVLALAAVLAACGGGGDSNGYGAVAVSASTSKVAISSEALTQSIANDAARDACDADGGQGSTDPGLCRTDEGEAAGAIAAAFAGLGSLIGGVINAAMLNPADLQSLGDALGVQLPNMDSTSIWTGQLGGACCVGLLNLALMAGLGAAGAALWWQISGKKRVEVQPPQY